MDALGLEELDRQILRRLAETFEGRPVGLGTLADSVGEAADTIEDVYEPYLLQEGLLQADPPGAGRHGAGLPAPRVGSPRRGWAAGPVLGGSLGDGGFGGGLGGASRQRPSRNQRLMVWAVGGWAGPGRVCSRARSSAITEAGRSPRRSAPRPRREAHARSRSPDTRAAPGGEAGQEQVKGPRAAGGEAVGRPPDVQQGDHQVAPGAGVHKARIAMGGAEPDRDPAGEVQALAVGPAPFRRRSRRPASMPRLVSL